MQAPKADVTKVQAEWIKSLPKPCGLMACNDPRGQQVLDACWRVDVAVPETVAVIGSGPAGLAAAYFLALQGYGVTIFEKLPVAGGMMAVGIPEYRLPRNTIEAEVQVIRGMGVEIRTGVTFGQDVTLDSLKKDGYKAVFLATGLHVSRKLNVPGEDMAGVLRGVEFLRDAALGNPVSLPKKVIVIGGGNVAIDVALTALRKGAEDVTLVCLEKREEMPAWKYEIEEALEEGIQIVNSWGPKRFVEKGGRIAGIEFKRCTSVFDDQGAFNPAYDEKDLTVLETEGAIIAIGQAGDLSFAQGEKVAVTRRGGLEADPVTLQTPLGWVFAGGDALYGPKSVVEAVAYAVRDVVDVMEELMKFTLLTRDAASMASRAPLSWWNLPKNSR